MEWFRKLSPNSNMGIEVFFIELCSKVCFLFSFQKVLGIDSRLILYFSLFGVGSIILSALIVTVSRDCKQNKNKNINSVQKIDQFLRSMTVLDLGSRGHKVLTFLRRLVSIIFSLQPVNYISFWNTHINLQTLHHS